MVTLYGIPRSVKRGLTRLFSGTLGNVLWKFFVLGVLLVSAYLLLAMGSIGAVIGGIIIGTLLNDDARAALQDIWHRRWAELESPW